MNDENQQSGHPVSTAWPRSRPSYHWWLFVAPFLWVGLMEYTMQVPRLGMILALSATIVVPGVSWLTLRHHMPRWALPLTVFVLLVAALAALSVVNVRGWQHVIAVLSTLTLYLVLRGDDVAAGQPQRGRITSFSMALTIFFLWLAALTFGVGLYVAVPWWWLAAIAGGVTAAVAFVTWASIDVPIGRFRRALPWAGLLGAELLLATWWLPTPVHVGAIVATTVIMLWLQVCRHIWLNDWQPGRGQRYIIIGTSVIGLVLLTARWT